MSARKRESAVEQIENWALGSAVGHASALEVDALGLTGALRLAASRATIEVGLSLSVVLLDGNVDWFSPLGSCSDLQGTPQVYTKVKADLSCTAVAAASIIAKVTRDRIMASYAEKHPNYGWEVNKGYTTPAHISAIREYGLTSEHRRSWKLTI
jgi:ribonuclease HII